MSDDLSTKTVLICDNGLFTCIAERLAREFGRVLYFDGWVSAFPRRRDAAVGEGVPGIERIYDLWNFIDKVDLWVFPDLYYAPLQAYLRSLGKRVWGAGRADWLELDRWRSRQAQKQLGLPAPHTRRVVGLDALSTLLSEVENVWVKVSRFRGDFETFKHTSMITSQPLLDDLRTRYGPLADTTEFIVEENIEGVELGYDGYCVDGQWPNSSLFGYEIKDRAYIGHVLPYDRLPEQVQRVNAAFAPLLEKYQCRSFLSFEMRITSSGDPYVIDPCLRSGSPPTEVVVEIVENLGEIFWAGGAGELIQPRFAAPYGAMLLLHSPWAVHSWTPLEIPADLQRWVKVRNSTSQGGYRYFCPSDVELPEIGAVVAIGETLEEATEVCKARAEAVHGYQVTSFPESFDEATAAISEGERYGVHFFDRADRATMAP